MLPSFNCISQIQITYINSRCKKQSNLKDLTIKKEAQLVVCSLIQSHIALIESDKGLDQIAFSPEDKESSVHNNRQSEKEEDDEELDLNISSGENEPTHCIPEVSPKISNKFKQDLIKSEPLRREDPTEDMPQVASFCEKASLSEAFEKQIHSVELRDVVMPSKKKGKMPLETAFCKKYAGIKISGNASFTERMEFDIYKRTTKDYRLDTLLKSQRSKLDKAEQEKLFSRLIEDGKRRNQRMTQLERFKQEELETTSGKKMNEKEFAIIYDKMMDKVKQKEGELKRQRVFQEILKEFHEQKVLEKSVAHNKKITKSGISNMLDRFEQDIKRRKLALKVRQEQIELMKKEEEKTFFKPDLSKKNKNKLKDQGSEGESTPVSLTVISDDSVGISSKLKETKDTKSLSRIWDEAHKKAQVKDEAKKLPAGKPPMVPQKTRTMPNNGKVRLDFKVQLVKTSPVTVIFHLNCYIRHPINECRYAYTKLAILIIQGCSQIQIGVPNQIYYKWHSVLQSTQLKDKYGTLWVK
eukprot:TRINITY_DN195_c0_g1_i1.p1 TRINITY_DN195_c0_g1~~TRINITY_DN195_c0_g1_i1.p1  ORF type:complete len:525 (-),score=67.69 TRINITY_DN195_c0_g1_i1:779-2353(-)